MLFVFFEFVYVFELVCLVCCFCVCGGGMKFWFVSEEVEVVIFLMEYLSGIVEYEFVEYMIIVFVGMLFVVLE